MPTAQQLSTEGGRNQIPDELSSGSTDPSLTQVAAPESSECPIDEFTLPHMRASSPDT